jgi:hypothetical protein
MKPNGWLRSLSASYSILANSIVLLVVFILATFVAWWYSDGSRKEGFSKKDFVSDMIPEVRQEYGHLSDSDVNELLSETWNMRDGGWVYEQWTGFRERARSASFVNVNEVGIRSNGAPHRALASANGSIWMFGGSTTFGYGVADAETIPAFLEQITSKKVINFGRGYYYSAQENMLLRKLLATSLLPSKVVFLDGINERCDIDVYQTQMGELFDTAQVATNWSSSKIYGPAKFLIYNILMRLGGTSARGAAYDPAMMRPSCSNLGVESKVTDILRTSLTERKLLCAQYRIECFTFVQPFAGVHGLHLDEKALPAAARDSLKDHYDALQGTFAESGAISIVDALDEKTTQAYVDNVHYSASANKLIAQSIASYLSQQGQNPESARGEIAEH